MTDYSDKEIVNLWQKGESKEVAFNLIVKKYQERLYWHIRKMVLIHVDADDVLQETFIKVWTGLDSFRSESQLFTWLYRIATNEALTFLERKKRKFRASDYDDVENPAYGKLESDSWFDGDEIQLKLQKAILTLPDKQRVVFNMKYFDDIKYEDMAEILGTSVGALKASYHHAVKKIELFFENN
ncbi:MAG: RNA polymerase subunit sigma [Bacteroidetes bacterium GWF2_38_335]|nr:MAG: RNA polymerase subunit sigma [Bacteroidetes bacterium GWF2_38_335]OFY80135.1 MAG: RNA polymerase subunit sigma [Bacteroidetes bacterium RIFOXYA12_FULL_38_20]HBS88538.1 RNA polymerase subunit sigma [Bacteroidales bacterium]